MGSDGDMEKRNSIRGTELSYSDQALTPSKGAHGVGGRQAEAPSPPGGGGYLDTCGFFKIRPAEDPKKRDPRLDELSAMGMPRTWLQVAETIGVDAFLQMWRILDADDAMLANGHLRGAGMVIEVRLRPYRSYLRFQRNRYIETLAALKVPCATIRDMLKRQLGEEISERHISNLTNKK